MRSAGWWVGGGARRESREREGLESLAGDVVDAQSLRGREAGGHGEALSARRGGFPVQSRRREEVFQLRRELLDGSYRPGPYRSFLVEDPKPRVISAAPFRDRVVHHAFTRVVEPIFERRFTKDSFACRKGMGTHAALERARSAIRRHPFVLKADVVRFFPSIDHRILMELLSKAIADERTLWLAGMILGGFQTEGNDAYFEGDDLFTPFERVRGLPLGNQTSQFFANVYLNPLDHFVSRRLRPAAYVRYVDDFLLFSATREETEKARVEIEGFLGSLRLRVHPRKSRVYRSRDGVTFLGWRLFPDRTRLVRRNVVSFRKRLRRMQNDYAERRGRWASVEQRIASWQGHAAWGNTFRLREELLSQATFQRNPPSSPPGNAA
jgi:RNA-directed DNA polymerase